jgi:hypothetical protein
LGKKLALEEGAIGVDDEEDDEAAVVDVDEQLVVVGRGGGGCFILKAPLPLLNSGSSLQYCKTSSS